MKKLSILFSLLAIISITVFAQEQRRGNYRMHVCMPTPYGDERTSTFSTDGINRIIFEEIGPCSAPIEVVSTTGNSITVKVTMSENCTNYGVMIFPADEVPEGQTLVERLMYEASYFYENSEIEFPVLEQDTDYIIATLANDKYFIDCEICTVSACTLPISWSEWQNVGTGSYYYEYGEGWYNGGFFVGQLNLEPIAQGLSIDHRFDTSNENNQQFRISGWGANQALTLNYDATTGIINFANQYTGVEYQEIIPVYFSSLFAYTKDPLYNTSSYDPSKGTFTLNGIYFCSAGYFDSGIEIFQLDGFENNIPKKSMRDTTIHDTDKFTPITRGTHCPTNPANAQQPDRKYKHLHFKN